MTTYLSKQKKGDLQDMAKQAGLSGYDDMLKDDLVTALDEKLRADSSKFAGNPIFAEFYKRGGSPTARRRKTIVAKVKDEAADAVNGAEDAAADTSTALATRTPRAVQRIAERVPLPPSPKVVSDYIARSQASFSTKLSDMYKKSGTTEAIEGVRDTASTVVAIEVLCNLIEAVGLQTETFPWRYAFDIPAIPAIKSHAYAVKLPDFFVLVTSFFWAPSTLWLTTSLFVPLLFAYFFNFSLSIRGQGARTRSSPHVYKFDPLTYNVSKALVTWLVYSQGFRFNGFWSDETVARVDGALFGGYQGVLIGTAIGALASLYEAILQKH
ncbi:hypothetical protein, variant [Verruconis gallopava]|uniref:Rho termination factor N-terminal domain-containing protein n=1 Tax=Verruconis gallopava TaxID=253628 RepID=A0A0D1Z7V9_9PEZI|nr:hypothetical protein, variant [Verruconis gallopava]KIW09017.1 hypothetical protein, variant [Verruconis gallopava]